MQTIARSTQCNQKQPALQVATGQVTFYAGATLLLAARLVNGNATGCCTKGSTPTQGTAL